MADSTKVRLGVCNVSADGVDLGHTQGGCTVKYVPDWHETSVDKYGSSVIERYLVGEKLSADVPLAESTLAHLKVGIPGGTVEGGKLTIGSSAGKRGSDLASQIVLHPIENESDNLTEDVVIWKGHSTSEIDLDYTNDHERIIKTTIEALVDESKDDGNLLGLIGDSTS